MKYGISFCLTALAVITMLVSACGGGGGGAPTPTPGPQTPQAVVFIALTTSFSPKNLTALQFQLQNDQLATTFTNFSSNAVAINGAAGAFIASRYDTGVNNIDLVKLPFFPTSARQPFIKIIYTRGSGLMPKFNIYTTTGQASPITSVFDNVKTVIRPSDFRITVQYL